MPVGEHERDSKQRETEIIDFIVSRNNFPVVMIYERFG